MILLYLAWIVSIYLSIFGLFLSIYMLIDGINYTKSTVTHTYVFAAAMVAIFTVSTIMIF